MYLLHHTKDRIADTARHSRNHVSIGRFLFSGFTPNASVQFQVFPLPRHSSPGRITQATGWCIIYFTQIKILPPQIGLKQKGITLLLLQPQRYGF